ncbi:DNA-directed RNA polymerase specialized sigma24 family protein [Streptomyces sp. SLBN-118]|uniref:RICIN domain-containing protein n=1 Tax=Streptomyces sp. SLBN-118 TaxID=2768454 RepID=UPI0011530816|nr:RICIN domain-containing protein [Streptomyces sp. SLBN-118]TQK42776.1 DNA-directed RNA polymerase specialized sigma24 family protein [Streptomyces sp. SLBN-118]
MPELHQIGPGPGDETPVYAALSDAELTERVRAGAPAAHPAAQELKRRHLPAALTYARVCGRNPAAGHQLAVQAFDLAVQEACRGIEPRGNWRHHVLMLVQRVGLNWAAGSRRDRLESGFAVWIDESADFTAPGVPLSRLRFEASSAMLTGFYRLPELTRGVLWYAVVDGEQDATVATFLNIRAALVPELRERAQDAMRQAYLLAYLERGGDKKCLGFRRIIEAAARPGDRRHSDDLTLHLAECPSCTRLLAELARMGNDPRAVFAEGLLGWGGSAYAARGPVRALLDAVPAQADRSKAMATTSAFAVSARPHQRGGTSRTDARWPSRTVVIIAVAVAGAVVAGTLHASEDSGPARVRAKEPPLRESWPAVAPPAPAPKSPTQQPSKKPSPSPSPTPSATVPNTPSPTVSKKLRRPPSPIVAGGGYTQVVNADSGLCLDIVDGVMENRTDVFTARCDGARTQKWSLDSIGLLHSYEDPDYCLDSRGSTDRGVGIWTCSSVEGRNGLNLLFTVDGSGAVRPQIAPDFALEPLGNWEGGFLDFDPADGDSDQRWTAGSAPRN